MRRMCAVSVWLLLVASVARAQVPPPPPPPPPLAVQVGPGRDVPLKTGTATIRGRVLADGSNAPVSRVDIRIGSAESPAGKTATTDANGRYELTGLPAGKFTLSASKPNYVRVAYGQTRPQGQGKVIELADGQTLANISFVLQRTGAITGHIVDEFGDPVTDVQVMAMRSQFFNGERRMMPAGGRPAETNDLGDYRIYGLAPGQYYITATLRNLMMGGATDDRSAYSPTYYPGTGSVAEAQRLTIAAGQTINGVNMTLLPVRTSRITGKALDAEGKPLVGAMVVAMERMGMMAMAMRSPAQVRPDGGFTLTGITPGNYILRIGMPGLDQTAVTPVTVTDGDITDVELIATRPSTIRGRVLVERGATPPRASTLQLAASSSEPMMGGGGPARLNDDFTFELKAPAGHYNIRLMGQLDTWHLHAVRLNGIDVTDTGIDLPPNAIVSDVAVEMTTKPSGATGSVVDENGQPARDAWVVMFAQDAQRWASQTRYTGAGRPNANNVYTVNVPAGDYFIVAVTDIEPGEWNDPDVLAQLRERATRVTIADGERKTVDLKVAR